MESNQVKDCFEEEHFGAITLDTSIFDAQGLRLESGLLKQLEQFRHRPTKLILCEVVKNEIFSHLIRDIKNAQTEIEKSLKQAKNHWQIEDEIINSLKNSIFRGREPQAIASERLNKFIEATSLELIEAQAHVKLGELIKKYFDAQPPFSEIGKKKNEFPDAISLMSLESWAEKNSTKVVVVTLDNDWKSFCKDSKWLVVVDDLAKALELFQNQPNAYAICKQLSEKHSKGELKDITEAIASALENEIWNLNIYPEASSAYRYEEEVTEISYEGFEFEILEEPKIIFRPIQFDFESLVVEAKLNVDVSVECNFYFFVYDSIDKDDVPIGSTYVNRQVALEVDVLVTLTGDLTKVNEDIEIDDVEVITTREIIDFGEVEPDWMHEDYEH
ncbi:hypothetical protein BZZ01_20540 [Nostocales cyanobacterium HT-58-2]|nr:hypothetical protein BZZ01_20540 [Nostocales cyanobacterium HT-58-2]